MATTLIYLPTSEDEITINFTGKELNTTFENVKEQWFKEVITIIRYCFLPIVVVGTCTNTLNIIVFSSKKMLSQSTANFLLALAMSDLGLMYFEVR